MKKGLDARAFALAAGVMWSVMVFIMTFVAMYTGYGGVFMNILANIYPGYVLTVGGAFLGAVYGFIDAFVGCYIFAWLYNKFTR